MATTEEIFRDAVALIPDARAELTEWLIASLSCHTSLSRSCIAFDHRGLCHVD